MWVELGIPKLGTNLAAPNTRTWVNTNYIVSSKFDFVAGKVVSVEVVSTKPGGCDRTIFKDDDAERLYLVLERERDGLVSSNWRPLVAHERATIAAEKEAELLKLAEAEKLFKASKAKTKAK